MMRLLTSLEWCVAGIVGSEMESGRRMRTSSTSYPDIRHSFRRVYWHGRSCCCVRVRVACGVDWRRACWLHSLRRRRRRRRLDEPPKRDPSQQQEEWSVCVVYLDIAATVVRCVVVFVCVCVFVVVGSPLLLFVFVFVLRVESSPLSLTHSLQCESSRMQPIEGQKQKQRERRKGNIGKGNAHRNIQRDNYFNKIP